MTIRECDDMHTVCRVSGGRLYMTGSVGGIRATESVPLPPGFPGDVEGVGSWFSKAWKSVKKVAKAVAKSKVFKSIAKTALNLAAGAVPGGRTALDAIRTARRALRGAKGATVSAAAAIRTANSAAASSKSSAAAAARARGAAASLAVYQRAFSQKGGRTAYLSRVKAQNRATQPAWNAAVQRGLSRGNAIRAAAARREPIPLAAPTTQISRRFREQMIRELLGAKRR